MNIESILPKLIRAGLENDVKSFEVISMNISERLKKKYPDVSEEINSILFNKNITNNAYRSLGLDNLPVGRKNNLNLLNVIEIDNIEEPILPEKIYNSYMQFMEEQKQHNELLKFGVKPSNSILLYGEPGVGKTYSAKWLSMQLNKPLITLDLSSVVSSYLGETGTNIKMVLDYAKSHNAILFLDEFDAIAKKRDDSKDIGELKRIVNVLLKELEEWPVGSIVIAATNHPELLDKAIWRRFDIKIEIDLPNYDLRKKIVKRELEKFEELNENLIDLFSVCTENINAAEIVRQCEQIKREYVLSKRDVNLVIKDKLDVFFSEADSKTKKSYVIDLYKNNFKVSEIEKYTSVPKSTIYRYTKGIE